MKLRFALFVALLLSMGCGNYCCGNGQVIKANGKEYMCRYIEAGQDYYDLVPIGEEKK